MYIFIDESGIFTDPNNRSHGIISSVGALVVPHAVYSRLIQDVKRLKQKWGYAGELKGSKLNVIQVNELLDVLEKHDLLFVSVMVDSKMITAHIINQHKKNQAEHILSNISELHHPNVINQIRKMSETIHDLSDQLYVQYEVMAELMYKVHQISTLYYVQRQPQELGIFEWIIDAKDKNKTRAEKWWQDTLIPNIEGSSRRKPLVMLSSADYSYYKKFDHKSAEGGNIRSILSNLDFADSAASEGLQLVDVITSVLTKTMNNKFPIAISKKIGRLMVNSNESFIPVMAFEELHHVITVPYGGSIKILKQQSKSMLI